jgi:hypothetical protein
MDTLIDDECVVLRDRRRFHKVGVERLVHDQGVLLGQDERIAIMRVDGLKHHERLGRRQGESIGGMGMEAFIYGKDYIPRKVKGVARVPVGAATTGHDEFDGCYVFR